MTVPPAAAPRPIPVGWAALAGAVAGGVGLAASELLAGLLPGAPSLALAVGSLVVALQPPGAKQFVVDLVGEADKDVLNLLIVLVALIGAAGLGVLGARRLRLANIGFVAVAAGAGLAGVLLDPLADPLLAIVTAAAAGGLSAVTLARLLRLAGRQAVAEMPDWGRRRFLGASLATAGIAVAGGVAGRLLLSGRQSAVATDLSTIPPPVDPATLPAGAELETEGLTPIVVPNDRFYRIDTALLVPRLDAGSWRLRVHGMVEREVELTYAQLLELPIHEQYVTIACVSNEVGGDLVGNALWSGPRLREVLEMAAVRPGATQIVGRAFDGWTAGFPTAWLTDGDREALIAVTMNGEPLPARHGYPARLIVPGLYGYVSATKWLTEIELTTLEAFDAYWVPLGWAKEAPIKTQSRIDVPRDRASLAAGEVAVAGVAWAPDRGIRRVEVRIDDGPWTEAEMSVPISDATWVQWLYRWPASPGQHLISARATDGTGDVQTADVQRPPPDGATGHHTIAVSVG